ncbi:hypothetical protein KSS87_007472, partial [Heliosperma pusillum]
MKKLNKEKKKKKKRVEVNHQEKCPMYGNITRKCPSQINQGIFVVYARFAVTKKIMKSYAWSIGTGFGSMSRHLRNDHGITASGVGSQTQTQLSGFMSEQAGGGKPFFYSQKNMIDH